MDQEKKVTTWFDTHCHLEMLKEDPQEILLRSQERGVVKCISIGTNHDSNQKVKELIQNFPSVWGTYGIHPHEADRCEEKDLEWIKPEAESNPKIVAIGECGLDFHYDFSDRNKQGEIFEKQLNIAIKLDYPVVIHTREAEEATREIMTPYIKCGLRGVFHSFTSSISFAKFALDAGFYLGFNGISTFKNAQEVRDVIQYTPLEQMLLETDSPYLTPVPFRGKPNFPGYVSVVGEFIADLLKLETPDFSAIMEQNTKKLFFSEKT